MNISDILTYLVTGVGGLALYLLKEQINDLKDANKKYAEDIDHIKENYFKKVDFSEFKSELWARLDRFEADVKEQLKK